jgi:hypothetical protein
MLYLGLNTWQNLKTELISASIILVCYYVPTSINALENWRIRYFLILGCIATSTWGVSGQEFLNVLLITHILFYLLLPGFNYSIQKHFV